MNKILVSAGLILVSQSMHADLSCDAYLEGGLYSIHWQAYYALDEESLRHKHEEQIDLSPFHITKDFQKKCLACKTGD